MNSAVPVDPALTLPIFSAQTRDLIYIKSTVSHLKVLSFFKRQLQPVEDISLTV